jgi:hypothetical protein
MHLVETSISAHNTPGREASSSDGGRGVRSRGLEDFSSPKLDDRDKEILSVVKDRPSTLLKISERTNIPFVETLFRARSLRRRGLLRKLGGECDSNGLYLYVADR